MMYLGLHAAATKEDWIHLPMPERCKVIPLYFTYSKEQFKRIQQGFVPEVMEQHWFVYVENGHIYFHRSWTGIMICDCLYEEKEDQVLITYMTVNRNPKEYTNTNDEQDIRLVKGWLDYLSEPYRY